VRVFVSGAAGFLGAHVAREGLASGWDVAGIDSMLGGSAENIPDGMPFLRADCRDTRHYGWLLDGADVVYHCAAAPYEGLSVFSPQVVAENTFSSTVALLTASINAGVKRFVFCSSMSRYGHQRAPFTEDMTPAPADPYAIAKVAAEQMVQTLCDLHEVTWVTVVPHNIYGPGQRYWDPYRNVAGIMINRCLQNKPPVVYGDGTQRRCLSYISDVTGPLLKLATENVAGEVFNVGPDGDGCTMTELAEMVMDLCEYSGEPEYHPARPGEVHTAHCSAAKAAAWLGYEPQADLKDGLGQYVSWVRERGPRPFGYHLSLEITRTPLHTPRTWSERLLLLVACGDHRQGELLPRPGQRAGRQHLDDSPVQAERRGAAPVEDLLPERGETPRVGGQVAQRLGGQPYRGGVLSGRGRFDGHMSQCALPAA
jgi:UDP-glucose 4-epimerase